MHTKTTFDRDAFLVVATLAGRAAADEGIAATGDLDDVEQDVEGFWRRRLEALTARLEALVDEAAALGAELNEIAAAITAFGQAHSAAIAGDVRGRRLAS